MSEIKANASDDSEQSLVIEFELSRNNAKTEDLRKRVEQKDPIIRKMELPRRRVNKCLTSYCKGENPRLPGMRYARGLFIDLR